MLGDHGVEQIVKLLNNTALTDFAGRVFIQERAPKYEGEEYIVVNHLPFVHRRDHDVEMGIININIHSRTLRTNEPPAKRLLQLAQEIVALFPPQGLFLDGAYYNYYADSAPIEDNDNTYYKNIQLEVTYNNLNYN